MSSEEERRWLALGIAMNQGLLPVLRKFAKLGMEKHYKSLAMKHSLKKLTYEQARNDTALQNLKFENINGNCRNKLRKPLAYNYSVESAVDLAKLYLPERYTHFLDFDELQDLDIILFLLIHNEPEPIFTSQDESNPIQSAADDFKKNVRDKWATPNFADWTEKFSVTCFSKLKVLVESLRLTDQKERDTLRTLSHWQATATQKLSDDEGDAHGPSKKKKIKLENVVSTCNGEDEELQWTQAMYRAGTEKGPSFEASNNEVWLLRSPALFYPLDQNQARPSTRASSIVCLWKTFSAIAPDSLSAESHPSLRDVIVTKLKGEVKESGDEAEKLKKLLRSMTWIKITVPACERGMSQMNVNVLVHAVLKYLHASNPVTPEDFNFRAELKAASHWYWFKKEEDMKFVMGPFDDIRVKTVALIYLYGWLNELDELRSKAEISKNEEDDSKKRISELEESIFSLQWYYDVKLEDEKEKDSVERDLERCIVVLNIPGQLVKLRQRKTLTKRLSAKEYREMVKQQV